MDKKSNWQSENTPSTSRFDDADFIEIELEDSSEIKSSSSDIQREQKRRDKNESYVRSEPAYWQIWDPFTEQFESIRYGLSVQEMLRAREMISEFGKTYLRFAKNREKLIQEIRHIAEMICKRKRNCNISTILGSTAGVTGSAAGIIGIILSPPLLIAGAILSVIGSLSNFGTVAVENWTIHEAAKHVDQVIENDERLLDQLELEYAALKRANFLHFTRTSQRSLQSFGEEDLSDSVKAIVYFSKLATTVAGTAVPIGAGASCSATSMSTITASGTTVPLIPLAAAASSKLVINIAGQAAMGAAVLIEGGSIAFAMAKLASGSGAKLNQALSELAKFKEAELQCIEQKLIELRLLEKLSLP